MSKLRVANNTDTEPVPERRLIALLGGRIEQNLDQIEQALRRLAVRQSVRSAYTSKIKQLLGGEKAKEFEDLYALRSCFLHDGSGRGNLGGAADAALEIGLELLLADIT